MSLDAYFFNINNYSPLNKPIRFMIYPNFTKQNEISLIEYILLGGFSLLIIGVLINLISSHKIIPDNDPRIKESEKLENAI